MYRRRTLLRPVLPAALLFLAACHRIKTPAGVVRTSDLSSADQLLSGFYGVEGSGAYLWRWTGPNFAVALGTPADASRGGRLRLRIFFPETQIEKLGPITLTAFIDGEPLAPETYSKAGSYDFVRDVPACVLDTNVLPVRFRLDKYSPKSADDGRDLGAVVLMAALEPK